MSEKIIHIEINEEDAQFLLSAIDSGYSEGQLCCGGGYILKKIKDNFQDISKEYQYLFDAWNL